MSNLTFSIFSVSRWLLGDHNIVLSPVAFLGKAIRDNRGRGKFAEADGAGLEKFAGVAEHIGFSGPFHGKFLDQCLVGIRGSEAGNAADLINNSKIIQ